MHQLQTIAYNAGHPVPLAIALDQENGGVNSLFDEENIRQFPSAMGIAATGSVEMAFEVAKATAKELSAVGVNWMLGPVLDVLTNARNQPLGVRTYGDDPQEVSQYGVSYLKGYKEIGVATCGKHFPSYGDLEFLGATTLDVPIITETLEQLGLSALVPFRNAVAAGIDAVMVGGCAMVNAGMNIMHACLSEEICDELLRKDLNFKGVIVSECLEMDALSHNIGVAGGTVMAVKAGCDVVLLCRTISVQLEAIAGLKLGVQNGMIPLDRIRKSVCRVREMKSRCTSWEGALNPPGIDLLNLLQPSHSALSATAYNRSITVVRDTHHFLPLSDTVAQDEELLLISPLLQPLAASAATQALAGTAASPKPIKSEQSTSAMTGEGLFRKLGLSLARQRGGRILHTSYTANGVRPVHENLIKRAGAVIIVTADANRNLYQNGFTKHIAMILNTPSPGSSEKKTKPLIVVAVSSPYDFAMDQSIGTYICTYDYTETALNALVKVIYGPPSPSGTLPGTITQSRRVHVSRQHWLVESWSEERDSKALDVLIEAIVNGTPPQLRSELARSNSNTFLLRNSDIQESHFVVRNSSTQALFGFCSTYFFPTTGTGVIGALFVDPARRKLSIGQSLHSRATSALLQRDAKTLQLGSRLPNVFLGKPTEQGSKRSQLDRWFETRGWGKASFRPVRNMILRDLSKCSAPGDLVRKLQSAAVDFDLVYGVDYANATRDHIIACSKPEVVELYKIALEDRDFCGILRAKRANSEAIVGTLIMCNAWSQLSVLLPMLSDENNVADALLSPIISPSVAAEEYAMLLQGLILLGIRQIKARGSTTCFLDYVRISTFTTPRPLY